MLTVDVVIEEGGWRDHATLRRVVRETVEAAYLDVAGAGEAPAEISVLLSDDKKVGELNERYRGRAGPTNVLSFPTDLPAPHGAPRPLGDIVIARETLAREAERDGKPLEAHLRHLLTHAVLHLLGYDHVEETDAARMMAAERRILETFGVADPYLAVERI